HRRFRADGHDLLLLRRDGPSGPLGEPDRDGAPFSGRRLSARPDAAWPARQAPGVAVSRRGAGIALAIVHVALVGMLGLKLLADRARLPRAWARTLPYDPS